MPRIFLSPSAQQFNEYVNGGTEEQYMNLLADAMEPYLRATGIAYTRNNPNETLSQIINQSNAGRYDLHLALHSNAAGEANSGNVRGADMYYAANSVKGKRAAEIIAENFKKIYPLPSKVRAIPTSKLVEVTRTKAPAVLMEVAYHDNIDDANWIKSNITPMARNIVESLAHYFGIPFVEPQEVKTGTVSTARGALNIRSRPSIDSTIIGSAPNGAALEVLSENGDWNAVRYNGVEGYAGSRFIHIS